MLCGRLGKFRDLQLFGTNSAASTAETIDCTSISSIFVRSSALDVPLLFFAFSGAAMEAQFQPWVLQEG